MKVKLSKMGLVKSRQIMTFQSCENKTHNFYIGQGFTGETFDRCSIYCPFDMTIEFIHVENRNKGCDGTLFLSTKKAGVFTSVEDKEICSLFKEYYGCSFHGKIQLNAGCHYCFYYKIEDGTCYSPSITVEYWV